MPDEPAGAGAGMAPPPGGARTGGGFGRTYPGVSAGFDLKIPGLETASRSIASVTSELNALKEGLKGISSNQYFLSQGISTMLSKITGQANLAAAALGNVGSAVNGIGGRGGGGGGGGGGAPTAGGAGWGAYPTASGTGWEQGAIGSAAAAQVAAGGGGGGGGGGGLISGGGGLFGGGGLMPLSLMGDLAMFPMRFLRDRIQNNRQSALNVSQALSGMAFASGQSNSMGMMNIMASLARSPLMGTQADLIQAATVGRGIGANPGLGEGIAGPRALGYSTGLSQLQRMTPGAPLGQLAGVLGGQIGNVGSQQQAAFLTSGAFAMVKMGGGMKTVQEWAEGILRWLENQRPGRDRGKPFTHGEILAQHFPGSNIDAWLSVNGVTPDMREAFWNYAEGKSKTTGGTQGDFQIPKPGGNLAWERLRSQTEFTRGEFKLASMMTGQYANREVSNQWFNSLMANIMGTLIPRVTGPGSPLHLIQRLPDFIEETLMGLLEATGPFGQLLGGGLFDIAGLVGGVGNAAQGGGAGSGGAAGNANWVGGVPDTGDIGDVGDYGLQGGTSTAGLHPDVRKRVNAMMAANPRLRVNSGLRDRSTQMRLRDKGYSNVTGKPSAHTRGFAADMGPRSEYSWIAAHAGDFGLSSGFKQGEPWHVGMGDIGDIIPDIPIVSDVIGAGLDAAGNLPIVGGVVNAARSVDDIIGMLGDLFSGFIDSIKRMGEVLGGGLLSIKDLIGGAGGGISSFLGKNIGGFMNLLLGPFGQFGTSGGAVAATPFDPGLGGTLPRNIALGGETRGFFGSPGGGASATAAAAATGGVGAAVAPGSNQAIGQQMAAARGWTGSQWTALQQLWQSESGWSHTADNPSSSAYGIPQALPGSKMSSHGADWKTNPRTQIAWGLDYIAGRYGTPAAALAFWQSKNPHWYAGGAWSTDNEYAHVHQDEMVLPATVAEQVRLALHGGGGSTAQLVFHNTFNLGGNGGGPQGGGIDIRRTVSTIADHLEQEMRQRQARNN